MAVDPTTTCEQLHAAYAALVAQLASLPAVAVSEGGRSISSSTADIEGRMRLIEQRAAALGCPIGTLNEPFFTVSGAKAV